MNIMKLAPIAISTNGFWMLSNLQIFSNSVSIHHEG